MSCLLCVKESTKVTEVWLLISAGNSLRMLRDNTEVCTLVGVEIVDNCQGFIILTLNSVFPMTDNLDLSLDECGMMTLIIL